MNEFFKKNKNALIISGIAVVSVGTGFFMSQMQQQISPTSSTISLNPFSQMQNAFHLFDGSIISSGNLTPEEAQDLLFMKEEEKLARDVYTALATKWGVPVFSNIASSEQQHMDAISALINTSEMTDTTSSQTGIFTNQELQKLYADLVAKGSLSPDDAYEVGRTIEQKDIADLQEALTRTENESIETVYRSLINGSENHLQAFSGRMGQGGGRNSRGGRNW